MYLHSVIVVFFVACISACAANHEPGQEATLFPPSGQIFANPYPPFAFHPSSTPNPRQQQSRTWFDNPFAPFILPPASPPPYYPPSSFQSPTNP